MQLPVTIVSYTYCKTVQLCEKNTWRMYHKNVVKKCNICINAGELASKYFKKPFETGYLYPPTWLNISRSYFMLLLGSVRNKVFCFCKDEHKECASDITETWILKRNTQNTFLFSFSLGENG